MQFRFFLAVLFLLFPLSSSYSSDKDESLMFHESFDTVGFLDNDVINRSGHLTAEDRGLTFENGAFGKGIKLNLAPDKVEPGSDGMHMILLDTVTRLIAHVERLHGKGNLYTGPIYWGTSRLNPSAGALSFWVKGSLSEGDLFCQSAMDWGRKEQYLLAVTVDENQNIGAYVEDARYERHAIVSEKQWNTDRWNHVTLNFDRAKGLELFINGDSVASSWGSYSWWETQPPGLLYLPMPHVTYDELFIFSRPLEQQEIRSLIETNSLPHNNKRASRRSEHDRDRLAHAVGLSSEIPLPIMTPGNNNEVLSWTEITPSHFGDGHIPARFCHDGGYELAWPHNIAAFTWVPGDADFQAEKLDVEVPNTPWNYISIEGNLNGMPDVLYRAKKENDRFTGELFYEVPQDGRFFFGKQVDRMVHPMITLPFLKGYGAPEEYTGDVRLPLTGKTRIHEVGIFDVTEKVMITVPGETTYHLQTQGSLSQRYDFAMKAVHPLIDRETFYGYPTDQSQKAEWFDTGYLRRINLVTEPVTGKRCVGGILLNLTVRTRKKQDVLLVRLHDPCLPHRIWTHAELKLSGFDGDGGKLRLLLEPPPVYLVRGDVIWLDIATLDNGAIQVGGKEGSSIILKPAPFLESEKTYEMKAIMPAMAEYSTGYEYSPWLFENVWPDIEKPEVFGGRYDILLSALAVQRVQPWSRLAEYYIEWSKPKHKWGYFWNIRQQQYFHGSDAPLKDYFPLKELAIPEGVPRWAFLQHEIQNLRYRFIDWLAANQNQDGQFGGGWNDDVLIMRYRHDIPLDCNTLAENIFLKINKGLDKTRQFAGGYCRILPIDTGHVHDFIRYRHNALLYKPGDPYVWRRAMETAWHWDKPDKTPLNYRDGSSFIPEKNMLEWLWGIRKSQTPFVTANPDSLQHEMARLVSYIDQNLLHRITEARVHTDHRWFEEERLVTQMIIGGEPDAGIDMSITWLKGGGEDLARWVTYADNTSLTCRLYSFDTRMREVEGRLFRIGSGEYEIALHEDINGRKGETIESEKLIMKRFDFFTVTVPPKRPVILSVKRLKAGHIPDQLPDLAVADYDCERKGRQLRVRVSNLGAAPSQEARINLYDTDGNSISQALVPGLGAPVDFVEKSTWVQFDNAPESKRLRVVVETSGELPEMFNENNMAIIDIVQ
ncbi:LamG-like jellyroll fold domain-containing protein [Candidatus Latescibacterota bacterium]